MHLAILLTASALLGGVSPTPQKKDGKKGVDPPIETGARNSVLNIAAALENSGEILRGKTGNEQDTIPKKRPEGNKATDIEKEPKRSVRYIAAVLDQSGANLMGRAIGGYYDGKSLQELSKVKVQSSSKPSEQTEGYLPVQGSNTKPNNSRHTSTVHGTNVQPDEDRPTPLVQIGLVKVNESGAQKSVRDIAAALDRSGVKLMGRAISGSILGKPYDEQPNAKVQSNPKPYQQSDDNPPDQMNNVQPSIDRPAPSVQKSNTGFDEAGRPTLSVKPEIKEDDESGARKSVRDIAAVLDRSGVKLMGRAISGSNLGKPYEEQPNVKVQSNPKPYQQSDDNPPDQMNNVQSSKDRPAPSVQKSKAGLNEGRPIPPVQPKDDEDTASGEQKSVRDIAASLDRSGMKLMGRVFSGIHQENPLQVQSKVKVQSSPKHGEQSEGNSQVKVDNVQSNKGRPTPPVQKSNLQLHKDRPISLVQPKDDEDAESSAQKSAPKVDNVESNKGHPTPPVQKSNLQLNKDRPISLVQPKDDEDAESSAQKSAPKVDNVQSNKGHPTPPVQKSNLQLNKDRPISLVQPKDDEDAESSAQKSVLDISAALDGSGVKLFGREFSGTNQGRPLRETSNVNAQSSPKTGEQYEGNSLNQMNNVELSNGRTNPPVQRSNLWLDGGRPIQSVESDDEDTESEDEKLLREIAAELDRTGVSWLMDSAASGINLGEPYEELPDVHDQSSPKPWEQYEGNSLNQMNNVELSNDRTNPPVQRSNLWLDGGRPIQSIESNDDEGTESEDEKLLREIAAELDRTGVSWLMDSAASGINLGEPYEELPDVEVQSSPKPWEQYEGNSLNQMNNGELSNGRTNPPVQRSNLWLDGGRPIQSVESNDDEDTESEDEKLLRDIAAELDRSEVSWLMDSAASGINLGGPHEELPNVEVQSSPKPWEQYEGNSLNQMNNIKPSTGSSTPPFPRSNIELISEDHPATALDPQEKIQNDPERDPLKQLAEWFQHLTNQQRINKQKSRGGEASVQRPLSDQSQSIDCGALESNESRQGQHQDKPWWAAVFCIPE